MAPILEHVEQKKPEPLARLYQKPAPTSPAKTVKDAKKAPIVFTDWASI